MASYQRINLRTRSFAGCGPENASRAGAGTRALFVCATILMMVCWIIGASQIAQNPARVSLAGPNSVEAWQVATAYYAAINHQIASGDRSLLDDIVAVDIGDGSDVQGTLPGRETLHAQVDRIRAISGQALLKYDVAVASDAWVAVDVRIKFPESPLLLGLRLNHNYGYWPAREILHIENDLIIERDYEAASVMASALATDPGVSVSLAEHQVVDPLIFNFHSNGAKHFVTGDQRGFVQPLTAHVSLLLSSTSEEPGSVASLRLETGTIERYELLPGLEQTVRTGSMVSIPPGTAFTVKASVASGQPTVLLGVSIDVDGFVPTPQETAIQSSPGSAMVTHSTLLPSQVVLASPARVQVGAITLAPGALVRFDPATELAILTRVDGELSVLIDQKQWDGERSEENQAASNSSETAPQFSLKSLSDQARLLAYSSGVRFASGARPGVIVNLSDHTASAWLIVLVHER